MHIVIITDSIDNQKTGIHYYTKNLVLSLLKYDNKNTYTLIHREKNNFYKNKKNIVINGKGQIYELYRKLFLLPKLINKLKADIVIEPSHLGPFRIKKPAKTISVIHDLSNFLYPSCHKLKNNIVHKFFLPQIIKNSDILITPSETSKKDIEKIFKRTKNIYILPPAISKPKKDIKRIIKSPYVLFLGTIEPRKNIETLIEAYKELKNEKKINHTLIIAGKIGWKSKKITKHFDYPSIKYLSYVDKNQKASLLKYADLFIFPSIYEGFGIPPLEAISYKTPVITSTGGSLKEIFGETVETFEAKDKKNLKTLICKHLNNPLIKKKFTEIGPKFAENYYREKIAKKFLKIINNIIN